MVSLHSLPCILLVEIVTRETGVVRPSGVKVGVACPGGVGWAATTAVPHGGLG